MQSIRFCRESKFTLPIELRHAIKYIQHSAIALPMINEQGVWVTLVSVQALACNIDRVYTGTALPRLGSASLLLLNYPPAFITFLAVRHILYIWTNSYKSTKSIQASHGLWGSAGVMPIDAHFFQPAMLTHKVGQTDLVFSVGWGIINRSVHTRLQVGLWVQKFPVENFQKFILIFPEICQLLMPISCFQVQHSKVMP